MAAPSALPGGQLWDLLGQWWHDGHCCLGGLQDWLSSPPGVCAVLSVHPPFCLNQLRFLLLGTTKLILPPRLYYLWQIFFPHCHLSCNLICTTVFLIKKVQVLMQPNRPTISLVVSDFQESCLERPSIIQDYKDVNPYIKFKNCKLLFHSNI